jgi:uncharacterized membrane protein YqjE
MKGQWAPAYKGVFMHSEIRRNDAPLNDRDRFFNDRFERETWKDMSQKLLSHGASLLKTQAELVRAELSEKFVKLRGPVIGLVLSGIIFFVGSISFAAMAIILLDKVTELWLAAAIVTVVFFATGAFMFSAAKNKLERTEIKPNRSIDTFGDIFNLFKE